MTILIRIAGCLALILLSGCTTWDAYGKHVQERAACKAVCQQRQMVCNQTCYNNCPECCLASNQRTARSYRHYQHQQHIKGAPVIRQLNSYRDPLQCRKTTCDCPTDYHVCIQACTGKIPKRLQVAPAC